LSTHFDLVALIRRQSSADDQEKLKLMAKMLAVFFFPKNISAISPASGFCLDLDRVTKRFRCMNETIAMNWWKEVRERLEHTARNLPGGFEQQTVVNLLADQDGLELVCEPYSDLEPRFAVYQALYKLFIG
jgi:hypothetical protein